MTSILDLLNDEEIIEEIIIPEGKEPEFILDLENPVEYRIEALNNYFLCDENGAIEILRQLHSMWFMCGIKAIENFFIALCESPTISSILKLSVAKSLGDENTNKNPAKNALKYILKNGDLPTPCRVEAMQLLLVYEDFTPEYFQEFIKESTIDEEFRYKTILDLENIASTWLRDQLLTLFPDKDFVTHIFTISKDLIKQEFPKFTPTTDNEDFFKLLLLRMNYDKLTENYNPKDGTINQYSSFIKEIHLAWVQNLTNSVFYRTLSAQYLLQKYSHDLPTRITIENILLGFAENTFNTENQRADAADTLLHLGREEMKIKGRDIIISLGIGDREQNTLFTNTQNVHNTEVEDSIAEIMEFFAQYPTQLINRIPITFQQVRKHI